MSDERAAASASASGPDSAFGSARASGAASGPASGAGFAHASDSGAAAAPGAASDAASGSARGPASVTPRRRARRTRTMTATMGIILLGFQLIVTFLCILGITGLRLVDLPTGIIAGAVLLGLQLAAIAVLQFTGNTILGWIVEIASVLAGLIHPGMFLVGGMFLAAWIYGMIQGGKVDRARAPIIRAYEQALAAGATEEEARAAADRVAAAASAPAA